ncbi:MAG: carboxypeptidase M32 [Spirochaetales bacterium]|uniref:Metal-dependent carboxypeptidase n=1 Tax=Candidatus Thalassospirochaeta sargassi TaxID=3119039 RepID=A0AAJ1IF39_9SPIO|nr:carboxypeptidase M32 [Spirochaetales bacterium]
MKESLGNLKKAARELYLLEHTQATVSWDQETQMPDAANEERSDQLALLEGIMHQKLTSPEIGRLLSALGADDEKPEGKGNFDIEDKAFVREMYRSYSRASRLPEKLVTEIARQTGLAHSSWVEARKNADFSLFEEDLEKIIELNREKAGKIGYKDHPYDALLDEYEPWMTASKVEEVFGPLGKNLADLTARIAKKKQVETSFVEKKYPVDKQNAFGTKVVEKLGYDFGRGRLDISAHPFTTTLGTNDVRITTRYDESLVLSGLFSNIHEGGHAMYEMGVGENIQGNILAAGVSLGIHESQSRFWENMIGRSRAFWEIFYPDFQKTFSKQTEGVSLDDFYKAVNRVEPSFIRVEADEVTYSLHVILRFEIEKAMLSGDLKVSSLPDEWNRRMKSLLGIVPADDSEGVLQDVHWSAGLIGYFPTYALGNLYAAQFMNSMENQLGDVGKIVRSGDFSSILGWLRENIHQYGRVYPAEKLCRRVTGESLNPDYFMHYLENKYGEVYGLRGN